MKKRDRRKRQTITAKAASKLASTETSKELVRPLRLSDSPDAICARHAFTGYDGGKTPLDDSDDLEAFAPVTGLNLYQNYFEISRVDPSGLTAMCTTIPESSGKGNPKTRCLKYKPYNGRFVKKVCVRQQCFFRCYCPGNDNCPRRPCKDPTCQRDHGVEMAYVSTEADRGIIPWLLGAGAPRCELLESTIAKKFDCDG